MSLILDALRKAEADRQRGGVPGLHAAVPPPLRASSTRAARVRQRWPRVLAAALLLAAVWALTAATWRMLRPAAMLAPAERAGGAATPVRPAAAPSVPTLPAAPPAPLPRVVSAPPTPGPVVAAAPAAPAPRPAPIVTEVRRLADLPPEQRRELPPLVVSGSVWSEQASARFVMLDGQLLREGDSLAPGLVLLKLAPRSATLRWRDSLFEVPF